MRQAGIRSRDPREHERHRAYARCFLIEGGVSMMLQLISAASSVIDLIYPPALYCICCGKIIDQTRPYRLCNDCMNEIKWVGERTCGCCGKRLSDADPGAVCFSCREHHHSFDRGYTCTEYGTHERAIVFSLKYGGRSDIAEVIGEIMADRMLAVYAADELACRYDLVLPVPLHYRRRSMRGYNQAALIAEAFARRTGMRSDDTILRRVKQTHRMRSLGPDQRRENIRGAFEIRKGRAAELRGKNILIIDDIYTTGATVDEISSVLREAGAGMIEFLSFTSGADMVKSM